MLNLNLKQLEVFTAVVDSGSFSSAAKNLFLAQSTVSGHLTALENELGMMLINRNGKQKVTLTEEGRKVYLRVSSILQGCADLAHEIEEYTSTELTIGASTIPMQYLLPKLISGFSRENPECKYTLKEGDSAAVHQMVLDAQVQLGFVGSALNRKDIVYEQLAEDRLVLVTSKSDRFEALHQEGVSGNTLLTEPLIFREIGSGTQQAVDNFLCENNVKTDSIRVVARIESNEAILSAVADGLGVAILSELVAGGMAEQGKTLMFPLEGKGTTRFLYMIHARDRHLNGKTREFWEYTGENSKK